MNSAILLDVRSAIKTLRRSPGFALIAIATLGLGIGANTSMFSILNEYLLRPAPYADRDRLDRIYRSTPQNSRGGISPADYLDLKAEMSGYGDIAAYADSNVSLAEAGKPAEMAEGLRISANLLSALATTPLLGRGFRPDEDILGNQRVLIISHRYWQNRFGADEHVIGRAVRVDGEPHEIVGVLPADFSDWRHLSSNDVYRPLAFDDKEVRDRNSTGLHLVGRRSDSLTRAQTGAFIANFGRRLAADFPSANAETSWRSIPIDASFMDGKGRDMVRLLVGLSGFVLLIACSNLANLLLARTMARAREFAVRAALGASRTQMLRPLLAESILLALAGGICAVFVALWTFDWLAVHTAADNGVGVDLTFDWRVLGWGLGACLFTAVAFGLAPALFALRLDLNRTLKSGSRGTTGDRGHQRFRHLLIVGQFALAMVLLAGAGLFVNGLHEMNSRRHGWESAQLVTGTLVLPASAYSGDKKISDFQHLALQRLEALPGVASASVSYAMPFFGLSEPRKYVVAGRDTPEPGHEPTARINGVSPRYFETVGTRMLSGRGFDASDSLTSPRVFIVNRAMADGLFRDENPIGQRIAQAGTKTAEWGEIVGVASDVEAVSSSQSTVPYQLYQPMDQEPRPLNAIAVRSAGLAPASLVESVRVTMMSLDPDLPLRKLQPADLTIARATYQEGVLGSVLSGLAGLGLGLASLGVYGTIARAVAQRTGEFGIRLALGAGPGDITRLVLTSGAKLALLGAALGLVGALGMARLIAAGFPGIPMSNASVLIGATIVLIAIAQVACYVPARHAARVSPTEALRTE